VRCRNGISAIEANDGGHSGFVCLDRVVWRRSRLLERKRIFDEPIDLLCFFAALVVLSPVNVILRELNKETVASLGPKKFVPPSWTTKELQSHGADAMTLQE